MQKREKAREKGLDRNGENERMITVRMERRKVWKSRRTEESDKITQIQA